MTYTQKMHDSVRKETKGKHNIVTDLLDEIDRLQSLIDSEDFWTNEVYPNGVMPQQVQNELSDYHAIIGEVAKVYDTITGGRISKPNTRADDVISETEDHYSRMYSDSESWHNHDCF